MCRPTRPLPRSFPASTAVEEPFLPEEGVHGLMAMLANTGTAGTTAAGDGLDTVAAEVVIVAGLVTGRRSTRRVSSCLGGSSRADTD